MGRDDRVKVMDYHSANPSEAARQEQLKDLVAEFSVEVLGRVHNDTVPRRGQREGGGGVSPTLKIFTPTASSTRALRTRKRLGP